MAKRADISLLFDLFVTSQRVRRVLTEGLAEAGMRPDEYAVYSLLFERSPITATEMAGLIGMPLTTMLDYLKAMTSAGHLQRSRHPIDGRALELSLSRAGRAAQKRANARWEVVRKRIEGGLSMPIGQVRLALQALDDAADSAIDSATLSTYMLSAYKRTREPLDARIRGHAHARRQLGLDDRRRWMNAGRTSG